MMWVPRASVVRLDGQHGKNDISARENPALFQNGGNTGWLGDHHQPRIFQIFYRVFSQAQFLGHASRSIQHRLKVSSFRVAWAMCVSVKYWEFNPPEMKNFPWWRVSVSTYFVDHTPPHGRDTFSFLIFCKFHKKTYLGRCLNTHTTCRDSSGVSPEIAATVHEDSCSKSRCAGTVIPS